MVSRTAVLWVTLQRRRTTRDAGEWGFTSEDRFVNDAKRGIHAVGSLSPRKSSRVSDEQVNRACAIDCNKDNFFMGMRDSVFLSNDRWDYDVQATKERIMVVRQILFMVINIVYNREYNLAYIKGKI